MTPYSSDHSGEVYHGECLQVMQCMPSDSIDTLITDPPYGLSFMGKKWDYDVPNCGAYGLLNHFLSETLRL